MREEQRTILWAVAVTGLAQGIKVLIMELKERLEAKKAARLANAAKAVASVRGLFETDYITVGHFPNQQGLLVKYSVSYTKKGQYFAVLSALTLLGDPEKGGEEGVCVVTLFGSGDSPREAVEGLMANYEGGQNWKDDKEAMVAWSNHYDTHVMTSSRVREVLEAKASKRQKKGVNENLTQP